MVRIPLESRGRVKFRTVEKAKAPLTTLGAKWLVSRHKEAIRRNELLADFLKEHAAALASGKKPRELPNIWGARAWVGKHLNVNRKVLEGIENDLRKNAAEHGKHVMHLDDFLAAKRRLTSGGVKARKPPY